MADRSILCQTCILRGANAGSGAPPSTSCFFPDGDMASGVMIVAEALGKDEAVQEKALVGASGFFMGRLHSRKKWDRTFFRFENSLCCRPHNNTIRDKGGRLFPWIEQALTHCAPHLDAEIDQWKPKVILALGATALYRLTGEHYDILAARGYVFREKQDRCWVVPTPHPAWLLRGNQAFGHVYLWDAEKAVRIAREGFSYEEPSCLMDPPVAAWEAFVEQGLQACHGGAPLAVDIETPYKSTNEVELEVTGGDTDAPHRISFAYQVQEGASVPWRMPYLPGIRRLLDAAIAGSTVIIWNRGFDRPRIEKALDMTIPIERTRDSMDFWHVLFNALDRNLGFATSCLPRSARLKMWKHLNLVEPAYYSVIDAVALLRNDLDIGEMLGRTGQMPVYQDLVAGIDPALEAMGRAGMLVDRAAHAAFKVELEGLLASLQVTMDRVVPLAVRGQKVWKTRRAAEKGLALLKEHGEVGSEAALFDVPGQVAESTCPICLEHPVTAAHSKRKYAKVC